MKQNKWKYLKFERYVFALLLAIELIIAFTFLGFIHINPISITTAYIPVVVTGCLLGPVESTLMGLVFGLASMYKASAFYVVSVDKIFSPFHSGNPEGSILLSVGSRVLFGFLIGCFFSIVKGRKFEKAGTWMISFAAPWLHAFLVYTAMGIFFPNLGYNTSSTLHIGINDVAVAAFCIFWVETAYIIYHSEQIKRYKEAVNQSADNPYLSPKIVGVSVMISILVIGMAVLSTGYFSDRAEYMLKQHKVRMTGAIESDLLHLQIQFLIAMLLNTQFNEYGAVGRVGGDEFAVMIDKEMSREELETKLEEFLQDISGILTEFTVSCSVGVYHFEFPKTIKELLTRTDEVLYQAKANGRACFVIK